MWAGGEAEAFSGDLDRDELTVPIIYVSHDPSEVRQLAERVLILEDGRVAAAGPPETAFAS